MISRRRHSIRNADSLLHFMSFDERDVALQLKHDTSESREVKVRARRISKNSRTPRTSVTQND